jgi:putative salt-induced outer membrane protein
VKGKWVRQLSGGLLLTSGNNDNVTVTGGLTVERQTDQDKFRAFVNGAYGKSEGVTTNQLIRGGAQYDRNITERYYWYAGTFLEQDKLSGVNFRLGIGPGVGMHVFKDEKIEFNIEGGAQYFYEQYKTASGSGDSSFRLRAAENFTYTFSPGVKAYQRFDIAADVSNFNNFIMNNEVGLESTLSENLKLRLSFLDRFNNEPPRGFQRNDIQIISSLVLGF